MESAISALPESWLVAGDQFSEEVLQWLKKKR